jgi:asparagine synthase (glutamine-hydrolysing)
VCGLAGIVDFGGQIESGEAARMADLLAHRGPDDWGEWSEPGVALAHRRLAILDLSRDGRQPMADEHGRYRLLHNGEVYNYLELRRELEAHGYRFRSRTDTEVILASYDRWGESCVARFNGMWAFAIWDRERRQLFCARDRFGVKPFYYRLEGGRLCFASELKAFKAEAAPFVANARVVRDFLEHALVGHTDETFIEGINELPAAHTLSFSGQGMRLESYWQLENREPPAQEPVDAFRELFLDSVRLRLRSDVPVGTCLSGGLDSSAIACAVDHFLRTEADAAKLVGERQQVFTAYFEEAGLDEAGLDERQYAEEVVHQTQARSHPISFSASQMIEQLPAIVVAQDEPFRSTSVTAQWFLMREARNAGLKVMLDGQGGDEVLGGYDGYFPFLFADLVMRGKLRTLVGELGAYRRLRGVSHAHAGAALARAFVPVKVQWAIRGRASGARALLHRDLLRHRAVLPTSANTFPDHFRRRLHLVLTRRLPELLRYEDRNSMAHSIEARVPFLDYRLVEFMFSLEPRHLIHHGRAKAILREALSDLLPPRVATRTDKMGFGTPEQRWLRGPLGEFAQEVFQSRSFRERGFVNAKAAQTRLREHREGKIRAGSELWRALCLELWAEAFLHQ